MNGYAYRLIVTKRGGRVGRRQAMRGRTDFLSLMVPGSVLALALAVVLGDLSHLLEEGGWYAVLGQFLAVATTLIMIAIGGVVVVALLALPFLFCFSIYQELHRPIGPLALPDRTAGAARPALSRRQHRLEGGLVVLVVPHRPSFGRRR